VAMGAQDERDDVTWVVFELTGAGERFAAEGQIEGHLRAVLGSEVDIFVPYLTCSYNGRVSVFNVMEGYVFVTSGLDERVYMSVAYESPYLKSVLHKVRGTTPVLMTVSDSKVRELQDKLGEMVAVEISEGMRVEVYRGICKGLIGQVVALDTKMAHVLIELRTLKTIRTIPRYALLPREEAAS